jgi:Winged helix DNA-binding domain
VSSSQSRAAASPDDQRVTAERCAAQLLGGDPAGSAEEVAGRLLAIQAQDLRGARLTIRARSAGLSASDVDAALSQRRSLIVTWLNRGTLHLVCTEDYWWLHPLTTPQLRTGNSRRLAQEGVPPADAERAVATVQAALAADGPLTRSELRERVAAAGVRTEGQAMVHILALASIRGLIVRGPLAGRDQALVLARDWLGAPPPEMAARRRSVNWPGDTSPGMPRHPTWTSPSGRASGFGMPGSAWPGAARSSERTAWPSCQPTHGERLPRCRRHCCWARSSRCYSAGLPGTLSSARTGVSSQSTACSGRSRWPTAGPWRPGTSWTAKSRSHSSRRWTP